MANFLERLGKAVSLVVKGEGQVGPGPYWLPVSQGWLPAGAGMNWWQTGGDVASLDASAIIEACVSAYAQTIAMCPGNHWRSKDDGGRERVENSALTRILKQPNSYQTISDFMLNAVRCLYANGNFYALALRNNRYEIDELHLMNPRSCSANIAYDGSVYYSLSGNPIIERMVGPIIVPARDVLHVKLNSSKYNPLLGESPIVAAALDVATNNAMAMQQLSYYINQARPSTVLQTDLVLDAEQVTSLRDRWNEQTRLLGAGQTPILTAGLKIAPMGYNAVDSQLAQIMKLNDQHIALAYRVPLAILGIGGSGPANTTEALMNGWLASSLGFALNHLEEAFGNAFGLKGQPEEYLEFDTKALLRSAFKDMVEAYARSTQAGLHSPDEARAEFSLSKVKGGFGEEPRMQAQVVPLSAAGEIPAAPSAPAGGAPQLAPPSSPPEKPPAAAPEKGISNDDISRFFGTLRQHADEHSRIS